MPVSTVEFPPNPYDLNGKVNVNKERGGTERVWKMVKKKKEKGKLTATFGGRVRLHNSGCAYGRSTSRQTETRRGGTDPVL